MDCAPRLWGLGSTSRRSGLADSLFRQCNQLSAGQITLSHVSTKDQVLSSELHGEALLTARRPELQPLIDHLRDVVQGRDDIRIECAGTIAGSWFASAARRGEYLIAAGLLMLAGPVDLDELDQWMRVGWGRRRGASVPYPDSED
jgi:hypothetical protein